MSYDDYLDRVKRAAYKVDDSKTPGYPLNVEYASNGLALKAERETIYAAAVYRLRLMLSPDFDFESAMEDPFQALCDGLFDPSTVFVKKEPHPSRKSSVGKYRCITPVSLVDQLVESALFAEYSDLLSDNLFWSGSAVGIGFTDNQMSQFCAYAREIRDKYGKITTDDVSGFDAVHTLQILLATCKVDESVVLNSPDWHRANRRWCLVCARSLSVFGSKIYAKVTEGMLNSGSKDTSRRNTLLRLIYTFYFSIVSKQKVNQASANGDDGISVGIVDEKSYVSAAEDCGITIRGVHQSVRTLDFCSHLFDLETDKAQLLSWAKGVYRILTTNNTEADARQFLQECRHNDKDLYRAIDSLITDLYAHEPV